MMNLFRSKAIKWIRQHDSMQCGVACLAMICRHYGKCYSLEYLDGFCHANVAGVSMLGIAEGAGCVGLKPRLSQRPQMNLWKSSYPAYCIGTRIILWCSMTFPEMEDATEWLTPERSDRLLPE